MADCESLSILCPLCCVARSTLVVKFKSTSKADAAKAYRERKKCEAWLDNERQRLRDYRANVSEDQRKRNNEKTKERMRRMRERKKNGAGVSTPASHPAQQEAKVTRSVAEKRKDRRRYKTEKQREYRAAMSSQKKNGIKKKNHSAYARKKQQEVEEKKKKEEKKRKRQIAREKRKKRTELDKASQIVSEIESASPTTKRNLRRKNLFPTTTRDSVMRSIRNVATSAKGKELLRDAARKSQIANKVDFSEVIGIARSTLSYRPRGRLNVNRKFFESDKELLSKFYTQPNISIAMPNKSKKSKGEPIYVMQITLQAALNEFKLQYPDYKIGMFSFQKARPSHVHLLRSMKWLQCVCDICHNIKTLCVAIHASMVRHSFDSPSWLPVSDPVKIGLSTLCHGSSKYSAACVQQKCSSCGTKQLIDDIMPWALDNMADKLQWKEWAKQNETVNGKEVSRMKLTPMVSSRKIALDTLQQKLQGYGYHSFFARWQQAQLSKNIESMKPTEVQTIVDFSENFTCVQQSEAQSAYYSHTQVTIHPCVCTYEKDGVKVRDSVVFVSNDLKHDGGAVLAIMNSLIEHLKLVVPAVTKLYIWSDGCASQYKSRQPFANLADMFQQDVELNWHYFGSRHGKNASDGESGAVKSKMSRLVLGGQVYVDSAKEFADAAAKHMSVLDGSSLRHVYYLSSDTINKFRSKQSKPAPIKGSRSIHAIACQVPGLLKHGPASCFCVDCREGRVCQYGISQPKVVTVFEYEGNRWYETRNAYLACLRLRCS